MRPTLISLALAALVVLAPPARPHTQAGGPDEREAQALAVRFMKRLRQAGDFQPLVSEFFPEDFAARLRAAARELKPDSEFFHFCERGVLLRATDADLRRAYVALMNLWEQQDRLGDAALDYTKLEGKAGALDTTKGEDVIWSRYLKLARESVPAEALRIAETDPLLKASLNIDAMGEAATDLARAGGEDAPAAEGEERAGGEEELRAAEKRLKASAVRDLARLRALTEKFERCVELMRGAVARLRERAASLASVHSFNVESEEGGRRGEEFNVYKLESETLEEEAFGLPAGSVLIRARIYPYEMAVTRLEGRLTILAVYPDFDGD